MTRLFLNVLCGLLFLACGGCGKPSVAAAESKERNSALYRKAHEAEQAGDIQEAIDLYRQLLIEEPRAFSAHFQLALLLQDVKEDYIGAVYHYQQYLYLRPTSDKSTLAQDRIQRSEQLLAPQILRKVGDAAEALTPANLLKANDRLSLVISQLKNENTSLVEAKERAEKESAAAKSETERLRELLNRMRATEDVAKSPAALPKKTDLETKGVDKPDANALKALRDEAAALAAEGNRATPPMTRNTAAATAEEMRKAPQKAAGDSTAASRTNTAAAASDAAASTAFPAFVHSNDKAEKKTGAEQRTYVVQPGDTLFRIAEKFYGDRTHWKKIRDANKTRIDPDGRVRAGQILVIPN